MDSAELKVASPTVQAPESTDLEPISKTIDNGELEVSSTIQASESTDLEPISETIDDEELEKELEELEELDEERELELLEELEEERELELLEACSTIQAPEFTGPEPISQTMDDDFEIVQYHPSANGHGSVEVSESSIYRLNPYLIDSLVGGDYSEYTSSSSSIRNSTSPTALTVVNTAEQALSRQRDYIIPQRKRAIEIVKTLVEGNFVQATKETT